MLRLNNFVPEGSGHAGLDDDHAPHHAERRGYVEHASTWSLNLNVRSLFEGLPNFQSLKDRLEVNGTGQGGLHLGQKAVSSSEKNFPALHHPPNRSYCLPRKQKGSRFCIQMATLGGKGNRCQNCGTHFVRHVLNRFLTYHQKVSIHKSGTRRKKSTGAFIFQSFQLFEGIPIVLLLMY